MEVNGLHPSDPYKNDRGAVTGFDGRLHARPALPEVEWGLLSTALADADAALKITDALKPNAFDALLNRQVFEALAEAVRRGIAPDLMTVTTVLRERDQPAAVLRATELSAHRHWTADVDAHCALLIEQAMKRAQLDLAAWLQSSALDTAADALEVQDGLEQRAFDIPPPQARPYIVSAAGVTGDIFETYREAAERKTGLQGASTGFKKLDEHTRGYRPGKHYVMLAAPGMGKTVFGVGVLKSVAVEQGEPCAYFCVEMDAEELGERLLIAEAGVSADAAAEGRLIGQDWRRLKAARERIDRAPITFDCTPGLSIDHIERQIRRLVRFKGVKVVVIDYLQRIDFGEHGGTYERGVSYVSGRLKALARELGIAIITLSQITREKAKEGKEPGKHDARGSGDVENDADVIFTLHRPEEVGIQYDDTHKMMTKGLCIIGLPKVRGGRKFLGAERLLCTFEGDHVRIVDRMPALARVPEAYAEDDIPF